jgi:hypothetical protein
VIARVVRERDEARDQLSSQRAALAVAAASAPTAAAAAEEMEVRLGATTTHCTSYTRCICMPCDCLMQQRTSPHICVCL